MGLLRHSSATRRPSAPPFSLSVGAGLAAGTLGVGMLAGVLQTLLTTQGLLLLVGALALVVALAFGVSRLPADSRARRGATGLLMVVVSFAAGIVLAAVGGLAGPLAMLVLPLGLIGLVAITARPVGAVVGVLLALPVGLQQLPGSALGLDLMQVVAAMGLSAAIAGRLVNGQLPVRLPRQLVWAVLFVAWGALAVGNAVDLDIAFRQYVPLLVSVALVLLTVTVVDSLAQVRRLLWVLMASASTITVPALSNAGDLRASYGGAVVANRLEGSFTQPNELGSFVMVVFVLGVALVLGSRYARERVLVLAATGVALLVLFLTLSRGSWIGAVCGGLLLLLLLPAARRSLLVLGVPIVLLAIALGSFAPENPQVQVVGDRVATLAQPGGGNPYDDRPRIWAEGRREVRLSPVVGHGPGNFPVVSTRSASDAQTVRAYHAHSVLLTVAAEYGLPGAALLVALTISVGYLVRDAMRRVRGPDAALVAGLAAASIAIAAQGVIDYTMRNSVLFTFYWLVLGLLVAAARAALAEHPVEQGSASAVTSRPVVPQRRAAAAGAVEAGAADADAAGRPLFGAGAR